MEEEPELRRLTVDDEAHVIRCINEGYRHLRGSAFYREREPEQFRWQYVDNPAGPLRGHGAFLDGELVAMYLVSPVRFKMRADIGLAAQSMDTITLPLARGRRLFTRLAALTYEAIADEGRIRFTYGFPNDQSAPGFGKYLGWSFFEPLPRFVRPLDLSPVFRKVAPALDLRMPVPSLSLFSGRTGTPARRIGVVPEDIDSLWESFAPTFDFGLVRDSRFLRWRYEDKPGATYTLFEVRSGSGRLDGFAVAGIEDRSAGRICQIMDVVTRDADASATTALLRAITSFAREEKASVLSTRFPGDHPMRATFAANGFVRVPGWISKFETRVGLVPHGPQAPAMGSPARWYFTHADSDWH